NKLLPRLAFPSPLEGEGWEGGVREADNTKAFLFKPDSSGEGRPSTRFLVRLIRSTNPDWADITDRLI
ncbi:MAG: hypothetical protein ACFCUQ_10545, partial [Kiloniellales bacterium]